MKYSNFNGYTNKVLKYAKLLCLKSILLILVYSCGIKKKYFENTDKKNGSENHVIISPKEGDELQTEEKYAQLKLGCERLYLYLDSLRGKRVAIVGNQTSMIGKTHLVDTLLSLGIDIKKVFAPEHGFRGDADAGEKVYSGIDMRTGIPLVSLYGNNKKPKPSQLADVDIVLYDIQDVGVRFYTYISTLHYVMESCAENDKPIIVLDRPNPNGHYVDGPVRDSAHRSFVGMHPVPIVYGMTIGEYALMINDECWLADSVHCKLNVVPCKNYSHKMRHSVPIPPSPNLRSDASIALYPSLCLFEATTVSIGRGTERPFEYFGHPKFPEQSFSFTPISSFGAKSPLWENKLCYGFDLNPTTKKRSYDLNLNWLLEAKNLLGDSSQFIDQPAFFDRLAGTAELRKQINEGWSAKEIRASWKPAIQEFRKIRSKYLLYD
ncbi:MAG: DUF1343 domain-containing protein [Crocinitomicaceae bacterium]|nr:MAG: DUF1343 domain-containing protein [Crocinitomicaceae bacterium]